MLLMLRDLRALWPRRAAALRGYVLSMPAVVEMLLLALIFLAMYCVLPVAYADAWAVDVRALAVAILFLIAACLYLPQEAGDSKALLALPLAALASRSAIVAYLARHFASDHAWLDAYRTM